MVVGFLLDMSNSTRLHWKTYQDAAIELVQNLLPGDDKYSGTSSRIATTAELLRQHHPDPEPMVEKIRKLKPGGGSALYDAIYMACTSRKLMKGEPIEPRRVLVIVGDGHDNASKKTLDEALEIAQRNLVTIYGISTVALGFTNEGSENLPACARRPAAAWNTLEEVYKDVAGYLSTPSDDGNYALGVGTGGYAAEMSKGVYGAIAKIAGEVTTQYILRYVPDGSDSGKQFRQLRVGVDLPNVKIRARKGYYAANP